MGAEITHGMSVPAFNRVRSINNIFMAENITMVSFLVNNNQNIYYLDYLGYFLGNEGENFVIAL